MIGLISKGEVEILEPPRGLAGLFWMIGGYALT